MGEYRKKPVVIEAVQLCWRNWGAVCDLLGDIINEANPGRSVTTFSDTCGEETNGDAQWIEVTIPTLEGDHTARHGDWIIRGVSGEFYPCKPEIFAVTYEVAGDEADLDIVLREVRSEVERAKAKHPDFPSAHHGWAVIREEVDELWDVVKADGPSVDALTEATQIAATAIRFVLDVSSQAADD